MTSILVAETAPPVRGALIPLLLLAWCVVPAFAVIVALGTCAPIPFVVSTFRQTAAR